MHCRLYKSMIMLMFCSARAIEEELLKDLSNKSELSDWFTREDVATLKHPLPERPNPKNVQNNEKITELKEQINWYGHVIGIREILRLTNHVQASSRKGGTRVVLTAA